ncbi:MAG: hypothetical protein RIF41_32580, partial [Polyangiaceae bacterium]
ADRAPAHRGHSGQMAPRRRANHVRPDDGDRPTSRVHVRSFTRAQPMRANQTLMVRYDDAAGLQARGIQLFTEPPPQPLIGSRGWRRGGSKRGAQRTRFAQPPP